VHSIFLKCLIGVRAHPSIVGRLVSPSVAVCTRHVAKLTTQEHVVLAPTTSSCKHAQVTPAWLLTHMLGPPSPGADRALGAVYVATFCFFAVRKFSQRIKDDIGDKSIFECAPHIMIQHRCIWSSSAVTMWLDNCQVAVVTSALSCLEVCLLRVWMRT
jgi:Uncharacterized integral membrane protein (DUF2301)